MALYSGLNTGKGINNLPAFTPISEIYNFLAKYRSLSLKEILNNPAFPKDYKKSDIFNKDPDWKNY
jgi:hypothetical protein